MTLTLSNFKQEIDRTILQRGRQYYNAGNVIDLEEADYQTWTAQVSGTEVYQVDIEQDAAGVLHWECTCPYDWGAVCKHVAAVLYAIEETFPEVAGSKPKKPRRKRQTRAETVQSILSSLDHQELVELLDEIARDDRRIANMLLARYGETGDDKKAIIQLVKSAVAEGKSRDGFIDYWGATRAARAVDEILTRGTNLLAQGQANHAATIAQAIVEVVVPALSYADDSTGSLGGSIHRAVGLLKASAAALDDTERQQMLEYCLTEAISDRLKEWDWRWDIAAIAVELISTQEARARVFAMLDQMAQVRSERSNDYVTAFLSDYDQEKANLIKLSVIERDDDEQAALQFIREHVDLHAFRQKLITYHLEQRAFDEVRQLCSEWLDTQAGRSPGRVSTYLGYLLEAAQQEKNEDEIIRLARELFFNTGDFQYYTLLKQSIPETDWEETVDRLIRTAEKKPRGYHIVPELLVREERWKELLTLAKRSTHLVETYRQYLEPRFPEEICSIYESMVTEMLKHTSDRGTYATAAQYLRRMRTLGQGERADEIIELMVTTYRNRWAMIEELNRVRGH